MLRIEDISYSVAGRPLIVNASATVPTGHKVGLVGRNGTGKTTLFRLIRGELALETGAITLPRHARIGGVAQEVPSSDVSLIWSSPHLRHASAHTATPDTAPSPVVCMHRADAWCSISNKDGVVG